jgi:23S rRNA pseudouridine2605 synthase
VQERLQKIISRAGIASRREAETIITAGRVAINGIVVTELGTKADPEQDRITLDGNPLRIERQKLYILLHKPAGYMTTLKDPEGRPIVTDLLKGVKERVYPVGRLDYNTEGLLLLTNDGEWANRLAHPRHEVDKEYLVRVQGLPTDEQLQRLASGVELDDGPTAPGQARLIRPSGNSSWIAITIHEGRYRQVRRMCDAVGLSVVRLKRKRYGPLDLGELRPGEYRLLTATEVAQLEGGEAPSPPPKKTAPKGPTVSGPKRTALNHKKTVPRKGAKNAK